MKMSKKKFRLPKRLLREINDYSNGGFVLYCLNKEGVPEVISNFDSTITAMALNHYISNWSKAIEAYNIERTIQLLSDIEKGDDKEDEGEGGEEPEENS